MLGKKIRYKNQEIEPDEIFLDSSNLPDFDTHQFEGRLERPISKRTAYLLLLAFTAISLIFLIKAGFLQIVRGEQYFQISENNHLKQIPIFANRGVIYDRNDELLAWNVLDESRPDFTIRKYTALPGASHVLGYLSYPAKDKYGVYYRTEFIGKSGVEESYDDTLEGEHGLKIIEVNAVGETVSESIQKPPKDGESLHLTIDIKVQSKFYEIIKSISERVGFVGGAGILMDVRNGEIIALVSYPEFDSEILSYGEDRASINKFLNNPQNPFLNRAISGLYTPGSIVKPFIASAALNENIISPQKEILSTGSLRVPNPYSPGQFTIFNDWKAHGLVDMRRALAVSSNVYFFEIGGGFENQKGLGIANIEKYSKLFGIGKISGIDIEGEVEGVIPNPEWKERTFEDGVWRIGDTYNTSIGQYGFQVTPIQMIKALSAITNGGVFANPHLVSSADKGSLEKINIPDDYFKVVREGMRLGAVTGTGTGLNVPYIEVATKTGTAELGVGKRYVNSWATGFFPYKNPKYAFIVVMEKGPRANLVGGVAVVRQLLDWMYYNTPEYLSSSLEVEEMEVIPTEALPTQPDEIGG